MFSDEKRFCLDGPHGWAHYWVGTERYKRYLLRRQQGGGEVMVWGRDYMARDIEAGHYN